jgi:hypothetical protein
MPAAGMSPYLENKLIRHLLKVETFVAPTAFYVSLHTVYPSEPFVQANFTEVTGSGYVRKAITWSDPGTKVATTNSNALVYTNLPAGNVVAIGVWDAATAGNMLFYGAMYTGIPMSAGSGLTINAQELYFAMM